MPAYPTPIRKPVRRVNWHRRWPALLKAARNPDWLLRVAELSARETGLRNALRAQGEDETTVLLMAECWVRAAMVQADEERRALHRIVPGRRAAPFDGPLELPDDGDQKDE